MVYNNGGFFPVENGEMHFLLEAQNVSMQEKGGSTPHNTHNHGEATARPKGESQASGQERKHYHSHHHYDTSISQSKTTASSSMSPEMTYYNVNVQFDPVIPQAGKSTHLNLIVTEQKIGEPIKDFEIIHDKLMHLIIVNREDLSHFAHIHPKLNKETGSFDISHTFANAGKYKMWIDIKPNGGSQILAAFAFKVEGKPVHTTTATITREQIRVKNVVADGQSYQVALNCQPEQLVSGRDIKMTFEIRDANGNPISNLEPLMAAGGHCVIIDATGQDFLHVHPVEEIEDIISWRGGPNVSFLANFPKPGLYRAWGQFQHEGRLLIADFTFDVGVGHYT
jgi:hypothetical protein